MRYVIIALVVVIVLVAISRLLTRKPDAGAHTAPETPDAEPKPWLRQFGDLTPQDFERHPVWVNCHVTDYNQPWYDETDEETFRPWREATPVDPAQTMFLVRASLRLADGTALRGFITPQSPQDNGGKPDLGLIQPEVFLPSGKRVSFWFGMMDPPKNEISEFYTALGKTGADIFPLTFNVETWLAIGVVSGSVPGFCSTGRGDEVRVEQ